MSGQGFCDFGEAFYYFHDYGQDSGNDCCDVGQDLCDYGQMCCDFGRGLADFL